MVSANKSNRLANEIVRRAQHSDQAQIPGFLEQAFSNRAKHKYPKRWHWQFTNNPFLKSTELPIWLALHQEKIIGQTAAMVEPVCLNDQVYSAGWSVDTFVLPEYRGKGLGSRLQAANQQEHDLFLSLSMSPENRHIKEKLGAVPLPLVSVYRLRLAANTNDIKQRIFPKSESEPQSRGALRPLTDLAANIVASCYSKYSQKKWLRKHQDKINRQSQWIIEEVERFPEEVNQMWESMASHYGLIVRRDAEFLNWKFCDQPHVTYRKYLFRIQEEIRGILILREGKVPEPHVGLVVELLTAPEESKLVTDMIAYAVGFFIKRSVLTVKVIASSRCHQRVYEGLGFKKSKVLSPVCHLKAGLCLPEKPAYFSFADHDLDQYPLATL